MYVKCMINTFILVSKYQIKTAVHVTVQKCAINYEEEINEFLLFTKKMWRKEFFVCFVFTVNPLQLYTFLNRGIITSHFLVPFDT